MRQRQKSKRPGRKSTGLGRFEKSRTRDERGRHGDSVQRAALEILLGTKNECDHLGEL